MRLCYVDESGCTGALPAAVTQIQPVFVLAGLVFDHRHLHPFTRDFLQLKRTFFPRALPMGSVYLDWAIWEPKGADLRRQAIDPSRRRRRQVIGFIDRVVEMVEGYDCRLFGRLWIKGIAQPFDGTAVYTSSMQAICRDFQNLLMQNGDTGVVIADSRNKAKNANVSHSIFTQKFKAAGDEYPNILEMVTFGHSENHAGLQVADLLCSALLFPFATFSYCSGHVTSVHVNADYESLKIRYGARIRQLQHRYQDGNGRWRGGVTVSDAIGQRNGGQLF